MNIGQVIQKIKDMIAAVKTGNYFVAVGILLEIIKAITDSMPTTAFGMQRPMRAGIDLTMATEDQLFDELDKLCEHPPMGATSSAQATGPIIDALLPILLALLKKWLGI